MIHWAEDLKVYLHREPVDFRKAIKGLSVIVQDEMALSPFERALFVFCHRRRTHLNGMHPGHPWPSPFGEPSALPIGCPCRLVNRTSDSHPTRRHQT